MYIDKKKKVLFVVGMEPNLECFIRQVLTINPENIIILERYGPFISEPFGDLMRDIIVAVYKENVEEIYVVATKDEQKNTKDILKKMNANKELQAKIKIVDYLFENCGPEFLEGNVIEWIKGSQSLIDGVQITVDIIRHHPLIPSHVKVKELLIDKENGKLSEIYVF